LTVDASPPVFLVGCHRSGTTLVRYLLDAHPVFTVPPESKFIAAIEAFLLYPQALRGLGQLGVTQERVAAEMRRLIDTFFTEYASRHGKRRWIDKTPNYYRLLPLIDRLYSATALYLFIVRHPFDTIDSLQRCPYFAVDHPEDPDVARAIACYGRSRSGWAKYWVEVYTAIESFAEGHCQRCLVFKYEDLVNDPHGTLASILRFLGEGDLPDDLVANAFAMQHTHGDGDWKIRDAVSIYTTSVDKWTRWALDERLALWDIVGGVASRHGYGLVHETAGQESRRDEVLSAPGGVA
jgi:hypothetical protein